MEPESNEDEGYDWSSLKPSTHDDFQKYVLLAHIVLGFIISVFSFSDGWFSWGVGTGLLPPLLLAVTGGVYVIHVGINWYRDEFIPYITRTQTFPEFETERFLKYQRIHRVLILISGYIALVITQYIWTQIANFLTPIVSDQSLLIQILSYILLGMVIVDLVILIIIFVIFESRLKLAFSDVGFILDIEEKRQQYDREKKKEEKEERERQKKRASRRAKRTNQRARAIHHNPLKNRNESMRLIQCSKSYSKLIMSSLCLPCSRYIRSQSKMDSKSSTKTTHCL